MATRNRDIGDDVDLAGEDIAAPRIQPENQNAPIAHDHVTPNSSNGGINPDVGQGKIGVIDRGDVVLRPGDILAPVNENDIFAGGNGDDQFYGGNGDDIAFGNGGVDSLHGDGGADTLFGGAGNDWLDGGAQADRLFGDSGNDTLVGGSGDDRLEGGADNDRLFGDAGADTMKGGSGDDAFFAGTPEFGPNGVTVATDRILDFHTKGGEEDILFLVEPIAMLTDFNERAGGNSLPKTAFEMGYIILVQHGSIFSSDFGTTVYIDSNGDAAGGDRYAVAELSGVFASDLSFGLPLYGGNFMV